MNTWIWIGFAVVLIGLLALDLGVLHRKPEAIGVRKALAYSAFWIALAFLFNVLIYFLYEWHAAQADSATPIDPLSGREAALLFFTGYLVEKSLSLDNIFVIALIFSYFHIPMKHQHRTLYWGIIGAIVLRAIMIFAGVALLLRFSWVEYVFGGILLLSAIKLLFSRHEKMDPDRNPLVRLVRRIYPVVTDVYTGRFVTRDNAGRLALTPLMLALIVVETTDVIFAVDSIPAILAITRDPFIVLTSNAFAILGLRSLYFALAAIMDKFRYMKISLALVLLFVAGKMLFAGHGQISPIITLSVIAAILMTGIIASIFATRRDGVRRSASINELSPKP